MKLQDVLLKAMAKKITVATEMRRLEFGLHYFPMERPDLVAAVSAMLG